MSFSAVSPPLVVRMKFVGRDPVTNARADAHGDVLVYGKERGIYSGVLLDDVKIKVSGGALLRPGSTIKVRQSSMGNVRDATTEERLRGVALGGSRMAAH